MHPLEHNLFLGINFITENLVLSITLILLFITLVVLSAFLSYAEAIFSTVNIIRLRNYLEEKKKGSKKAVYISEKYDYTLTTIIIVNTFIRVLATFILGFLLTNLIDNTVIALIVFIIAMTTIILVFAEVIPRAKGQNNPETKALRNSGFLYFIIKLSYPLTHLYVLIRRRIIKESDGPVAPRVTGEELESIIDVMETQGVFEETDAEMIQNAITLSELTVYDIMAPRVDMIAMDVHASMEEYKEMFFEYQYSRVPVFDGDKDNILGILSEKDFFTSLLKHKEFKITDIITEPYYVSGTMKVNELIHDMSRIKKHFGIVVDEYGGTNGIVTMEDALEEIVGEIYDEFDIVDDDYITKIADTKYLIDREMYLEDMFELLELGDAPDTSFSSVGGFIYSLCDGIPLEGDVVNYEYDQREYLDGEAVITRYNLVFTLKKVENRRIKKIELEIINKIEEE